MADVNTAGQSFLNALKVYLHDRVLRDDVEFDQHVTRYGDLLEAIGFERDSERFKGLMEHMRQMKDAGRVPHVQE